MTNIQQLVRDEAGATTIEYALIASLVAVVIIGAVTLVGTSVEALYSIIASEL